MNMSSEATIKIMPGHISVNNKSSRVKYCAKFFHSAELADSTLVKFSMKQQAEICTLAFLPKMSFYTWMQYWKLEKK